MQSDPASRALARNTKMGIPDADNDPMTRDAAPAKEPSEQGQGGYDPAMMGQEQQVRDDDDQHFEDGGEVGDEDNQAPDGQSFADGGQVEDDKWPDEDGLSKNIEDRRGEAPTAPVDGRSTYDFALDDQRSKMLSSDSDKWADTKNKLSGKFYDGGGEVEGQETVAQLTPDAPQGAIPEPEQPAEGQQPGFRETMGNAIGMRGQDAQKKVTSDGEEAWRTAAMEGINAGLDYGRNVVHGVNRPVSDETHEQDHHGYLTGKGAMDGTQFMDAQKAVDPQGTMDSSSRLQKTIGSVYDFYKNRYGADSAEPGTPAAKAVWSILQYARRAYDAYASHAIVAGDKGAPDIMAQSATNALGKVPGGMPATVTPIGMGDPAMSLESGFKVQVTDPDTGKVVTDQVLSRSQLTHLLTQGTDRLTERGLPASIEMASQTRPGSEQHPKGADRPQQHLQAWRRANPGADDPNPASPAAGLIRQGQSALPSKGYPTGERAWEMQRKGQGSLQGPRGYGPPDPGRIVGNTAKENGLPEDVNTNGMSVGEMQRLKTQQNEQNLRGNPALDVEKERSRSRIEAAKVAGESRTKVAGDNNKTKLEVTDKVQTGLTGRQINSPSQQAQNERALLNRAATATENWRRNEPKPPTPEQIKEHTAMMMEFYRTQMRAPGGQAPGGAPQPAPPAPAPAAPPQQQAPGQPPTKEINGWLYRANPQTKQWEPVQKLGQ